MSDADTGLLHPLSEPADSLTDADDDAGMSFGLREPALLQDRVDRVAVDGSGPGLVLVSP